MLIARLSYIEKVRNLRVIIAPKVKMIPCSLEIFVAVAAILELYFAPITINCICDVM